MSSTAHVSHVRHPGVGPLLSGENHKQPSSPETLQLAHAARRIYPSPALRTTSPSRGEVLLRTPSPLEGEGWGEGSLSCSVKLAIRSISLKHLICNTLLYFY
jgi:hypothetical protein